MPIHAKSLIFVQFNPNPNMSRHFSRNEKPVISERTVLCGLQYYMHTEGQPDRGNEADAGFCIFMACALKN